MLATVLVEEFEQVTIYRDINLDLLLGLWERGPAALPWGIVRHSGILLLAGLIQSSGHNRRLIHRYRTSDP